MNIDKIFDPEMTKEKFVCDKKLKNAIYKRQEEILEKLGKLGKVIFSISNIDFNLNYYRLFLTNDGYIYQEFEKCQSYSYELELVGYLEPIKINNFIKYLLEEEKVLKREPNNETIYDANLSITLIYNDKMYNILDDIFCSNPNISKYRDGVLSSRIKNRLYKLGSKTDNIADYKQRLELMRELRQLDNFLDTYDDRWEIPDFLKAKSE
ncbi:MAG: hypothetical protein PHO63_05920 [Bacilli bacterium]|nr:hypothetical protein [Bacilli bacterium]